MYFDLFQWYNEALSIATEHLGENNETQMHILFNTGLHHQDRGELKEAYGNVKQS